MKEKGSASPPQSAPEVGEVKWSQIAPKGPLFKELKRRKKMDLNIDNFLWKCEMAKKYMTRVGQIRKSVLQEIFERKIDSFKNLGFWNGCYSNILYNICVEK